MKNAEKFSDALAANSDGLKDFMGAIADVGKSIKPLTAKLETLVGDADNVVKGEIAAAAKSIKKAADDLDSRMKEIAANINRFSGSGLRQYEALAVDGRKTLEQFNQAVRSLENNPAAIPVRQVAANSGIFRRSLTRPATRTGNASAYLDASIRCYKRKPGSCVAIKFPLR